MLSKGLLKDIISVLGSNVFIVINNVLISILIARTLGPEEKGLFESIFVIPLIAITLAELGISRSIIYYTGKKTFKNEAILSASLLLLLLSSIIAIGLSALLYFIFNDSLITTTFIIIILTGIPFRLFISYCRGSFLGKEKIKEANMLQWFPVFLYLLILLFFHLFDSLTIRNGLISYTLSGIIVAIIAWFKIYKNQCIQIAEGRKIILKIIQLGLLFSLATFVIFLNYRVDILLLKQFSTFKQIGIYSLGVSVAEQLWQLPTAIGVVMISRSVNSANHIAINKDITTVLRLTLLVSFIGAILIYIAAPFFVIFLYGQAFAETGLVIRVLLPGILFFSIFSVLGSVIAGIGKTMTLIKIFVPVLILNIIINIILIPHYGAIGAAMATNISYTAGAIVLLIAYKIEMKTTFNELLCYKKADFYFIKNKLLKITNKKDGIS